jgi:hypothetical protein
MEEDQVGVAYGARGEMGSAYKILVGKPEEEESTPKQRYVWKDNVKVDFRDLGCGLDRNRRRAFVLTEMNLWIS